ncbi:MAG: glycosyltransferase family 4 protein [Melioribacteraceae bacterium]|nr:glycosyltransferase family 4 protein [Melioribacteraceae bacterium]
MGNNKKKVLKVLFPYKGDSIGGSFKSSLILIKELQNRNFQIVIALHESGKLANYIDRYEDSIDYIFYKFPVFQPFFIKYDLYGIYYFVINIFKYVIYSIKLSIYLRRARIDIVHSNDPVIHFSWFLACIFSHKHHIIHVRTSGLPKIITKFVKFSFRVKILVVSDYVKRNLALKNLNEDRVTLIYNPFHFPIPNKGKSNSALRKELGASEETVVIGSFGNFIERKNPDIFAETYLRVKEAIPEKRIIFIWVGQLKESLLLKKVKTIVGESWGKDFYVLDFRPNVDFMIEGCDLLFIPAIDEPYGRTLIEAMLLKTPLIAFNSGGNNEIIENDVNGLLCSMFDIDCSVNAIIRIINDKTFANFITNNGRDWAQKRHNIDIHVNKVVAMYRHIIC